jgi:hypothetical protein
MAKNQAERKAPDMVPLSSIQQKRLAALTEVDEASIKDKTIAQLSDTLKWEIDPRFFRFRKFVAGW